MHESRTLAHKVITVAFRNGIYVLMSGSHSHIITHNVNSVALSRSYRRDEEDEEMMAAE